MHSRIRIGLFALLVQFLFAQNLIFAQTRPMALPPLDSLSYAEMLLMDSQLLQDAQNLSSVTNRLLVAAGDGATQADNILAVAKADTTASKSLTDSLLTVLKQANARYKKALKLSERAKKAEQFTSDLTGMDSLGIRKNLPKAWKLVTQVFDDVYPALPADASPKAGENPEKEAVASNESKNQDKEKVKQGPQSTTKKYSAASDVMLHPPTPPCVIASSSRDEFSGEISRELARAELFRYTNPALKAYLQGKTHVICEAALASTGNKATLHLTFKINDPNARKAFGRLEKNSIATLKFLDGSIFELQNAIADDGVFSPDNDASIFHAVYPLNPEALKKIRRNGLDKLRILWSKGFDDYDVQQVDLLMRQAECLFK